MVKYYVSFAGIAPFSVQVGHIYNRKGKVDFPAMFKHVREMVGSDANVEMALTK